MTSCPHGNPKFCGWKTSKQVCLAIKTYIWYAKVNKKSMKTKTYMCVVPQFWIVHMFSQFELSTCSLSLCTCMCTNWENMCTNWENMCTNWENMCTNWENMCTNWENMYTNWENMCSTQTERTCAQLKLREHVLNSNWENMCSTQTERTCAQLKLREHVLNSTELREHVHNWENMCSTQTERTCTQLKLREHVFSSNWENMCITQNWETTHIYFFVFGFLSTLAPHTYTLMFSHTWTNCL